MNDPAHNADALQERIEALIRGPQYAQAQAEKDSELAAILAALCRDLGERCPAYGRFLSRLGRDSSTWQTPADCPPLPVSMFKQFYLAAVSQEKIVRELHSSSTTGTQPSRIIIDKTTAFRQGRALISILKEHIGGQRRPYLVLDVAESVASGDTLDRSRRGNSRHRQLRLRYRLCDG